MKTLIRISLLAAAGGLLSAGTMLAANADVSIFNYRFVDGVSGNSVTSIHPGDSVTWHWVQGTHSTTSGTCDTGGAYGGGCTPDGGWNSGTKSSGTFAQTFDQAGNFGYFCQVHGAVMTGIVRVASGGGCGAISLSPSSLPSALLSNAYSQTLSASGGTAPYTFAVTSGAPPDGLHLSSAGALTGTPTGAGSFSFTVTATDSGSCSGDQSYTIAVSSPSGAGSMRFVPGVAAVAGVPPSDFKTQFQMSNQTTETIGGKLVFHPAGLVGTAGDPSLPYTLGAWQTVNFDDLLPAMGQSGLGTLDVVPTSGPAPVVNARIYNDGGAAGTVGFSEAALRPQDALQTGETGFLIAPSDLARFRFNLGVRTLSSGVTATIEVWDSSGNLVTSVQKQYPKTFFLQAKASDFLGVDVPANASVEITVTAGSAVFYGSVVDNVTQDPSTQFAIHDQVDE